jgi:uncharacterized membrane protein
MNLFQRIVSSFTFFILVLLLFLALWENQIVLPLWLQVTGRMHPLLLHLPIGFLIIAFVFWMFRNEIDSDSFRKIFGLLLQLSSFTAVLTALMGLFLSREGGYEAGLLTKHKWFGIAIAAGVYILSQLYFWFPLKKALVTVSFFALLFTIVAGSHLGASLTHGEDFLLAPLNKEEKKERIITDSTHFYSAAIEPILEQKCFSCHNEKKSKGKLVMTSLDKILEGGKGGPIWVAGDPSKSHIIQMLRLPMDDKKHMPPKGKNQLTGEEITLIETWIFAGADTQRRLKEILPSDTLYQYATAVLNKNNENAVTVNYAFKEASPSVVSKLNDPFLLVTPIAQNSPALQAEFFIRKEFDKKKVQSLYAVKEQLVSLDLTNMPLEEEDIKLLAPFTNLERLNLNKTNITGKQFAELKSLGKLKMLSLAGTKINNNIFSALSIFPALTELYVWNTDLNSAAIAKAKSDFKSLKIDAGYVPDTSEILKLTPPILQNETTVIRNEQVVLKHNLPGVDIRFTLDGSEPDSLSSPIYKAPVSLTSYTQLKARSVKKGWYSSDVAAFNFFKKGFTPSHAELIYPANDQYKGEGAASLIDLKKGEASSFKDAAWLGFREKPFAAYIYFDTSHLIRSITVSYGKNIGAYILPPAQVEIWGGDNKEKMRLIKMTHPKQPEKLQEPSGVEGLKLSFAPADYKCYKIIARPVAHLPKWHPGKGEKSWVFVDEIFFNE